jgi:hypothetical protein
MKVKKLVAGLTVSAALGAMATPAIAGALLQPPKPPGKGGPVAVAAPEIDAKSGTMALALVIGALLLASERFRRRG